MNRKKKMFVFFFIFTLAACGLFSSMNAYAEEDLENLRMARVNGPNSGNLSRCSVGGTRDTILNRTTKLKVHFKERIALHATK